MIGVEHTLPNGYKGLVYGKKTHDELQGTEMQEVVMLESLGSFEKVTEWQKDKWSDDRGFPKSLVTYLDCAKLIHS